MGGWTQAITSGIGEGANDVAKGAIANTEQMHQFTMDYLARQAQSRQLDIAQAGQQQAYKIASSAQAIQRQTMEQAGWVNSGVSLKQPDGTYNITFNKPGTGETQVFKQSYPPADSFEGQSLRYDQLKDRYPDMPEDLRSHIAFGASGIEANNPVDTFKRVLGIVTDPKNKNWLPKGSPYAVATDLHQMITGTGKYSAITMVPSAYNIPAGAPSLTPEQQTELAGQMKPITDQETAVQTQYDTMLKAALALQASPVEKTGIPGVIPAGRGAKAMQDAVAYRNTELSKLQDQANEIRDNYYLQVTKRKPATDISGGAGAGGGGGAPTNPNDLGAAPQGAHEGQTGTFNGVKAKVVGGRMIKQS